MAEQWRIEILARDYRALADRLRYVAGHTERVETAVPGSVDGAAGIVKELRECAGMIEAWAEDLAGTVTE